MVLDWSADAIDIGCQLDLDHGDGERGGLEREKRKKPKSTACNTTRWLRVSLPKY